MRPMRQRWRTSAARRMASPMRRMASPMTAARRRLPDARLRTALSWLAAAALIVAVAFVVALPGADDGNARATPAAAAMPTPLPIAFGTALDAESGEATGLTERFAPGDTFVYSVRSSDASTAELVHVEVLREAVDGLEPVQTPAPQEVPPGATVIAFQVPADVLIGAFGEGSFRMRIYVDPAAAPVAEGRFRLVAPPAGESAAP
jgi:hypothetical protein